MSIRRSLLLVCCGVLMLAGRAGAVPTQFGSTGLMSLPSADTLNSGNICVGLFANCSSTESGTSTVLPVAMTLGLGSFLEAYGSYPNILFNDNEVDSGRGYANVGFKARLIGTRSSSFKLALDGHLRRNVSDDVRYDGLTDKVGRVVFSYKPGKFGLHGNYGIGSPENPEGEEYDSQSLYGVGLEYTPTTRLRLLAEYDVETAKIPDTKDQISAGGAVQYFISPHMTFNLGMYRGVSGGLPDWRVLFGLSSCQGVGTYQKPIPRQVQQEAAPAVEEKTETKTIKVKTLTPLIPKAKPVEPAAAVNKFEVPVGDKAEEVVLAPAGTAIDATAAASGKGEAAALGAVESAAPLEISSGIPLLEVAPQIAAVTAASPLAVPVDDATGFSSNGDGRSYRLNEVIKTDDGRIVGKKVVDDLRYSAQFVSISETPTHFILKFFHKYDKTLDVWVEGTKVKSRLSAAKAAPFEEITVSIEKVNERVPYFKLHLGEHSEVFEFYPQSRAVKAGRVEIAVKPAAAPSRTPATAGVSPAVEPVAVKSATDDSLVSPAASSSPAVTTLAPPVAGAVADAGPAGAKPPASAGEATAKQKLRSSNPAAPVSDAATARNSSETLPAVPAPVPSVEIDPSLLEGGTPFAGSIAAVIAASAPTAVMPADAGKSVAPLAGQIAPGKSGKTPVAGKSAAAATAAAPVASAEIATVASAAPSAAAKTAVPTGTAPAAAALPAVAISAASPAGVESVSVAAVSTPQSGEIAPGKSGKAPVAGKSAAAAAAAAPIASAEIATVASAAPSAAAKAAVPTMTVPAAAALPAVAISAASPAGVESVTVAAVSAPLSGEVATGKSGKAPAAGKSAAAAAAAAPNATAGIVTDVSAAPVAPVTDAGILPAVTDSARTPVETAPVKTAAASVPQSGLVAITKNAKVPATGKGAMTVASEPPVAAEMASRELSIQPLSAAAAVATASSAPLASVPAAETAAVAPLPTASASAVQTDSPKAAALTAGKSATAPVAGANLSTKTAPVPVLSGTVSGPQTTAPASSGSVTVETAMSPSAGSVAAAATGTAPAGVTAVPGTISAVAPLAVAPTVAGKKITPKPVTPTGGKSASAPVAGAGMLPATAALPTLTVAAASSQTAAPAAGALASAQQSVIPVAEKTASTGTESMPVTTVSVATPVAVGSPAAATPAVAGHTTAPVSGVASPVSSTVAPMAGSNPARTVAVTAPQVSAVPAAKIDTSAPQKNAGPSVAVAAATKTPVAATTHEGTSIPTRPVKAVAYRKFRLPSTVTFAFDDATLTEDGKRAISEVVEAIQSEKRWYVIRVDGYTDNIGSADYNEKLGLKRAIAVASFMVTNNGVDPAILFVKSSGEADPIASNESDEGRALNRRAEIVLFVQKDGQ